MLIIGCGNRQRGDDAAGVIAAERLCALGIATETRAGDSAELIDLWSGVDDVIVIDAVVTDAEAGTVHVWDAHTLPRSSKVSGSTHGLGVAEAVELARAIGCLPARLRVYGIEARTFEFGSEISPEVERGVEEVVRKIGHELGTRA